MTAIESVEAIGVEAPLDEPFGYSQAWVETRTATLVRVEADDGTVGWGECWGPVAGTVETVEEVLAPVVEGEDPRAVERRHDELRQVARATYQTVEPLPAISGVDLALWDLAGKLRGEQVSALLGGARRDAVRAYATGHYFRPTEDLDKQFEAIAAEASENAEALGAVKLKTGLAQVGADAAADVELVRRVRETVGRETTVMVDANYAYDRPTAREVGRVLADLGVHWFEEPVHPEDLAGYADLRETLDVRVAGGECHTPAQFDRLFEVDGLDVAQPDVCIVGGLTPAARIADRAAAANVPLVPHVWGTPVALAASLHLIATLHGDPWLEFDRSPNPLREDLAARAFAADADGRVAVPEGPGLGVDLDVDAIERFRV
ncbi:MAG: mandelate racemase/muconate lactonizing enzyme family protein [Halobacteriaceae archaeon]